MPIDYHDKLTAMQGDICYLRQQNEKLKKEIAALKKAARPFISGARIAKERKCSQISYSVEMIDKLAALVGEG